MRKYMVYMDDGSENGGCFKVAVPAENEKKAREYVAGNGEVIAIKDVTETYPIDIRKVQKALADAGFGKTETMYIVRTLEFTDMAD